MYGEGEAAISLMRPTLHAVSVRSLKAGSLMRDLHGLAPGGVCRAPNITVGAVVSYTTFSPFSRSDESERDVYFL